MEHNEKPGINIKPAGCIMLMLLSVLIWYALIKVGGCIFKTF